MTIQFKVGKTYFDRSVCDHECIFKFTVLSRTAKTVTISGVNSKTVRRGLAIYDGAEQFKPFGDYSFCAIVRADRELTVEAA